MSGAKGQARGKVADGLRCSFCGKRQNEVDKLIAGPGVYICNDCVDLCRDIVAKERGDAQPPVAGPPAETYRLHLRLGEGADTHLQFPLPLGTIGLHLRVVSQGQSWIGPCPKCGAWTVQTGRRTACFHCGESLPDAGDAPVAPDPRD